MMHDTTASTEPILSEDPADELDHPQTDGTGALKLPTRKAAKNATEMLREQNRREAARKKAKRVAALAANGGALEESELRAAQIVAAQHGADIRYCTDAGKWYVFDCRWMVDMTGSVPSYVKRCAMAAPERLAKSGLPEKDVDKASRALQSSRGVSAVTKLLESEWGIPVRAADFDTDRFALNFANGTVSLRNGELREHRREDLITHLLTTNYRPDAKCPKWEAHVDRITGGDRELARYLQKLAGLCASGDIGVQEFFVFYGGGSNGKSVFVDVLMALLATYAGVAPESLLMARDFGQEHPTEIMDLMGKRLVVASETENGGRLRLQLVKRMTGDATMKGRFMRQDFVEFPRTHKTILVTNNKPRITENTEAVWRRVRLVPFTVTIPVGERIKDFDKLLIATEAEGILNWIVRGSIDRLNNGMEPPEAVLRATDSYRAEGDSFAEFVTSELVVDREARVSRKEIADAYRQWAARTGETEPLADKAVYDRVRLIQNVEDGTWKLGGMPVRGFKGVGLKWQGGGQQHAY